MEITLSDPAALKKHELEHYYKELFYLILVGHSVYINRTDMDVENWDNEIRITLFKCEQSNGCGTAEYRQRSYENLKQLICEMFPEAHFGVSWRWVAHYPRIYTKLQDTDCIDGFSFLIKKGVKVKF